MGKTDSFQKDIELIKKKFLKMGIKEDQVVAFLETNLDSNIFEVLDLLSYEGLSLFISKVSQQQRSDIIFNRILNSSKKDSTTFNILKIILQNNFIHIKNYEMFYNNFQNHLFKIYEPEKNIYNFYMFICYQLLTDNEVIKLLFKRDFIESSKVFRERLFLYAKNVFVIFLQNFVITRDTNFINDTKREIFKWDLWDYVECGEDIHYFFDYLSNSDNLEDVEIFKKMNEISNKTFKNFDIKFDNFKNNIVLICDNLYEGDKDIEVYFDNLSTLEKTVVRDVLQNILKYYNSQENKKDQENDEKNEIKDKILKLLIEEEFKKNKNPSFDTSLISITPIADTFDIYNETRQDIDIDTDKIEVSIEGIETLDIEVNEKSTKIEDIKKENRDRQNEFNNKTGDIINTKDGEDEVLKIAIEIVKEINLSFKDDGIKGNKLKVIEIVRDILVERKRIDNELKLRTIIDKAIYEVLNNSDFEEL